ncbi:hypothetical protein EII14_01245 [Alloprevotella sp. OH1205_COT-284]|uniref:tetratricopeptide repeat protein n=1 Tax=Alloprevotella sp. OH1205_COT-284 TaxID=2491043 RepID=UPI000F5F46AA|nr:hypothetical protein [Alloprevotella sp. OH1205_COT-284]RRD80653.1 hypothetical protein EII14_01245 [Alloprevotella sp. OH1205_COT-284]
MILVILCAMCNSARGQAPLKQIKAALKANKATEAFKLVEQYRKDTLFHDKAQLLIYGFEAAVKLNDVENERFYLKQKTDTTAFFFTLYNVFDYALLADSITALPDYSERKHKRLRKKLVQQLNILYPNLNAATQFFMRKRRWEEAAKFSRMAIEAGRSPMFSEQTANLPAHLLPQYAERYMFSNFALKKYSEVDRYAETALKDSNQRETIYEAMAQTYQELNKQTEYAAYLQKGISEYPRNMFFFTRLADLLIAQKQTDRLLRVIDTLLNADAQNAKLYEYQAKVHLLEGRDSLCILSAKKMQQYDTTRTYADYYIGKSYFNLAQKVEIPQSINATGYKAAYEKKQHLYRKARPYIEFYRKNYPEDQHVWSPILYEIYWKLNLGKEFEEILKYTQK